MANSTFKITTLDQLKVALQAAKTYIDGQINGLGSLAGKSEVAYDDLAAALKALIDGKADGSVVTRTAPHHADRTGESSPCHWNKSLCRFAAVRGCKA